MNQMIQSALAPYAVEHSRGRRHPEPPHPYRNDFQRDRDRVIHSRAFRRLEAKTQVFTRRYSDHFRNRLTHSIEVGQISRTIAGQLGLNVDLVEALALVHDIGHPPFGHAGERALDNVMRRHGLFFDHNLHALRIVEDFELRYAAFRGLNLTFEVREGIIKHSRDYSAREYPELAEYLLDLRPPLEAQLIDITDELAYNTADLDDGYEAHLLTLEQIAEGVPLFARLFEEIERLYPEAPKKMQFNEVLRRMLDRWVTDLIENTREQIQDACSPGIQARGKLSRARAPFDFAQGRPAPHSHPEPQQPSVTSAPVPAASPGSVPISNPSASRPNNFCTTTYISARRSNLRRKPQSGSSQTCLSYGWRIPTSSRAAIRKKLKQSPSRSPAWSATTSLA